MSDVQLENGYTMIANEILDNIAKLKLSPTQHSLVYVIWRYTYGFKRKKHKMSLSFLARATNCDSRNIQRELKRLDERNIIKQSIIKNNRFIGFNKNYHEWNNGETDNGEIDIGETDNCQDRQFNIGETDKETIGETTNQERKKEKLKESIPLKKESKTFSDSDKEYKLSKYLSKCIAERLDKPLKDEKTLQSWSLEFNKMVRLDKYDFDEMLEVLQFSQTDEFWKKNILSAAKFRKQYLTLLAQMKG